MNQPFLGDRAVGLRASVVRIINGGGRAAARWSGGGAGIAWAGTPDLFVTSAHVVDGARVSVITPDARVLPGVVVARDTTRDIALVRAPGAALTPVVPRDPYELRSGSILFAVGHPFGVTNAVSVGVFQAVGPVPRGFGLNGQGRRAWVQADVRLAPGNSGGPLADVDGRVVGVAAMVVSGLALAVPAGDVARLVAQLK